MNAQQYEERRKRENTQYHVAQIARAFDALKRWPCITTINNMRMQLDGYERDIKAGDAIAKTGSAA